MKSSQKLLVGVTHTDLWPQWLMGLVGRALAPPGEQTASLPPVLAPKWRQTFCRHHLTMFINDLGSQLAGGREAQRELLVVIHINGERPPVFHCHDWQLTTRPSLPHFEAPPLLSSLHDLKLPCLPLKDWTEGSMDIQSLYRCVNITVLLSSSWYINIISLHLCNKMIINTTRKCFLSVLVTIASSVRNWEYFLNIICYKLTW